MKNRSCPVSFVKFTPSVGRQSKRQGRAYIQCGKDRALFNWGERSLSPANAYRRLRLDSCEEPKRNKENQERIRRDPGSFRIPEVRAPAFGSARISWERL